MSAGVDVPLDIARAAADSIAELLAPACDRIEIAGSIRRRKTIVHDIEIVAIPRVGSRVKAGLFGDETEPVNMLEEEILDQLVAETLERRPVENHRKDGSVDVQEKLGPAFKALVFDGIPVDLFITDAERWGCIFALRTGPGDWNVRLVMDCKRVMRSVAGGRVLHLGKPVPTPEEADFFREIGQPWLDPWDRAEDRVAITWPGAPPPRSET